MYFRKGVFIFIVLSFIFFGFDLFAGKVGRGGKVVKKVKKSAASLEWLKLPESTLTYWKVERVEGKAGYLRILPRWRNKSDIETKKIFGLMSKKSKSYKLAVTALLDILFYEGLHADIVLANFNKDESLGKEALLFAGESGVDIIFAMGSETASLVHRLYTGESIPVVAAICKDPVLLGQVKDYEGGTGTNIAFTSLNIPLDIQLNYLTELKPNLKNIGLMYDSSHKQVMAVEVMPAKKAFKEKGLYIVDIAVDGRGGAADVLRGRLPFAINEMRRTDPSLENSIFWITSSTAIFSNIETINEFSSSVPVLSSIPNVVSEGKNSAVLAVGVDRRNNAHLAGLYVIKILRGEARVGDLKVGVVTPPDIAINFLIARKIGLKIPFRFFESASFIYNYEGKLVRAFGQKVNQKVNQKQGDLGGDGGRGGLGGVESK